MEVKSITYQKYIQIKYRWMRKYLSTLTKCCNHFKQMLINWTCSILLYYDITARQRVRFWSWWSHAVTLWDSGFSSNYLHSHPAEKRSAAHVALGWKHARVFHLDSNFPSLFELIAGMFSGLWLNVMIYDQTWPALMPQGTYSENKIADIILCPYWFKETVG